MDDAQKIVSLQNALRFISGIAWGEYERNEKLRARPARTFKRIAERATSTLQETSNA